MEVVKVYPSVADETIFRRTALLSPCYGTCPLSATGDR
jgi:hypothetical protein